MPKEKNNIDETVAEPLENETPLSDIVENKEDKEILKPAPKKKSKFTFGYVTVPTAFLRKEADEDSEILTILRKGEAMLIDKEVDDFYYGTINTKVGYVPKEQMEIK